MKQIHSINSITIPFSAQQIWTVLTNIPSYPLWWPSTLKIKVLNATQNVIGSQVEIRPYGGMPFYCEFSQSVEPVKLVMKYSGIYSGLGVWTLSEINGQTKVDYEINLVINNLFIRLLSYVIPVEKIHYKLMNEVLLGLESRLKKITS
jgi:ribosome-associated toxin RatA of RatAB toxin-antitoxin module